MKAVMKLLLSTIALSVLLPGSVLAANMDGMNMGGSPADEANMKAMQKMHDAMPKKGTGNADKDFVTMMLPHHQGAVDMAKVELRYGKDPELRKLAAEIIKAQEKEIGQMRAWEKQQNIH